jgi:hypothetical protein
MELLPIDILKVILHFIDTIPDSLNVLRVCREWLHILSTSQGHWKLLALEFWNGYRKKHVHAYGKYVYDLEWAQAESEKDWLW